MKWRVVTLLLCLCASTASKAQEQPTPPLDAPRQQPGIIVGTAVDVNNEPVPGASVTLEGPALRDPRAIVSNDSGFFEFKDLEPGSPYHVTISAVGFADWTSDEVILKPGQYVILTVSKLRIATALTQVNVGYSPVEIATEQVKIEEQQRIFGFIPNFYAEYDPNAAPLTTKLKFQLAAKVSYDPVTLIGVGVFAAANQAGDRPNYPQGAKGYAERYGAVYADGVTDIMIGGAVLPSLLHQDPRYYYQGTGTNKSRVFHALRSSFVCKGDNGQWQPNYSTVGGDLASAALSNAYYPSSNRGVGLFLSNFFVDTGQRAAANLAQEFLLRRLTKAKNQK
ncbi:MAG: carboxypeptidase-like regulatory domain-containing protein [Candidatus Sulfotelmatobacter sp.]|jgi:Carboxypeptidase regulatory-like domain